MADGANGHHRHRVPASIRSLIRNAQTIQLDLGCGSNKRQGFVGMDVRAVEGVDLVHNLTKTPWPLPDRCTRLSVLSHVWEHLPPWTTLEVMREIHRVSQHDAILLISGPYGLGFRFVQDPTHCNPVNEATFAYFDPLHQSGLWHVYRPPVFHLEAWEIVPAAGDRDFETALRVCHHWDGTSCPHAKDTTDTTPKKRTRRSAARSVSRA